MNWCKLDPSGLKSASIWMEGFGQFENIDLDVLELLIEKEMLT